MKWSARIGCGLLIAAGLGVFPGVASAHNVDTSYCRVEINPSAVDLVLTYDLATLLRVVSMGDASAHRITKEEFEGASAEIGRYLKGHIFLAVDQRECDLGPALSTLWPKADGRAVGEADYGQTLVSFRFHRPIPAMPEYVALSFDLFQDLGTQHSVLGIFSFRGSEHPVVFSQYEPDYLLDLSYGTEAAQPAQAGPREAQGAALRLTGPDATDPPWWTQLPMYLKLGFRHIVPEGVDHILFVLGLFFLGITWRKLLFQTSIFTVAHATTLFLSTYGIFSLPSRFVEPAIALSIAFIAAENVFFPRLGWARLTVVFCFGLVHGLGFASSLSEVRFPKHQFVTALLGFNFGVDFGQLFVIALAFLAVGWFRREPWFRSRISVPCSLSIAAIGIAFAAQRVISYWV